MNKRQYQPRILTSVEKIFSVIMLFFTTNAVLPLFLGEADPYSPPQIRPTQLAITVALYSVAFYFMAIGWRKVIQNARDIKWIVALVSIAIASMVWSQDPSLTLRRSALLLATTMLGVYFGTRYTVPQQLRLLAWTFSLVIACSFFFAIFLPKYGIDQDQHLGAWQGVFLYKNWLAKAMVLAMSVFLFVRPRRFPSLRWLGVAASLALLFLSRSATGMVVCAGIITIIAVYRLIGGRDAVVIPFIAVGLLLVAWPQLQNFTVAEVLQLVGRTPDLTGRTDLWSALLLAISKRPLLGYGFNGFWLGMRGESASVLLATGLASGHNGFVDVMLELGGLGLVTFVAGYLVFWQRALGFLSRVPGPVPAWLCMYLVFMLLYNLTESSLLAQNSIYWVLYTSTAVSLSAGSFRQLCNNLNGQSLNPWVVAVKMQGPHGGRNA